MIPACPSANTVVFTMILALPSANTVVFATIPAHPIQAQVQEELLTQRNVV